MLFHSYADTRFHIETSLFNIVVVYKHLLKFKIKTKANEAVFGEILLNLAYSFHYETKSKCHTVIC